MRDIESELKSAKETVAKATEKVAELESLLSKKDDGTRAVVVCTTKGGVFFGYAKDTTGDSIFLKNARNAYYWKCTGGVLELGNKGPQPGSKIGERADITLNGISAVIECTEKAVSAWEMAKWG